MANGYYILDAEDNEEVVKLASMIPATTVEVYVLTRDATTASFRSYILLGSDHRALATDVVLGSR